MIVLGEENDNANTLHVILGPETENQFNFQGRSVMDISDYLKNMDPKKPCQLIVNRCESEEEIIQLIDFQEVQKRTQSAIEEVQRKIAQHSLENLDRKKEVVTKHVPTKSSNTSKNGIACPLCLEKDAARLVEGMVHPCKTCQEIEDGRADTSIEPAPGTEDLEILRHKIESDNPDQKKSLQRFMNSEEVDTDEVDDDIDPGENCNI